MAKNWCIIFKVTKDQFERIKQDAGNKGLNLSSYLRNLALSQNRMYEKMLVEIYKKIMNEEVKNGAKETYS